MLSEAKFRYLSGGKFVLLTLIFLILTSILIAQQVERDMVVVETFTATWCPYCPGCAMGIDDLIANGCDVAVVGYHPSSSDPFYNTYALYRKNYYGSVVGGFPTAIFDGVLSVVGGSHSSSMYSYYLPRYNQRKAINSSFTIDIAGENTGLDYDVTITVTKVAPTTSTSMVLQLALTESDIQYNWQGQTELNYVERLMVPNQNGTPLDFSGHGHDVNTIELTFTLASGWAEDNCELTAFVQDNDTKEVLQGTKVALPDLLPPQSVDDSNQLFVNSNLIQNYPNPFNSTTVISYRLNRKQVPKADIVIYNIRGQKVKGFSNLPIENGSGSVVWDGADDNGMPVQDGIYFYKISGIENCQVRKMVMIR